MRILTRAAAGAASLAVCIGLQAKTMTGGELRRWITSNDGALRLAATMYIVGVIDDDALMQAGEMQGLVEHGSGVSHFCPTQYQAKGSALQHSVARMVADKPEYRDAAGVLAVRAALARDYPCK
ncbi:Rap1a/Tai family immunity protein [Burkholderia cenocepacia]|uniref:Rap1a/Tai family immunity protein n=1 Tax=Burkholderia cenocepacia TaxID=95486 RepID=UPI0024B70920|nr:Rap1a/Tai family immunity protein [Burkholderia cenocepacia]MDI9684325.1 Rap1a/Tai family immunity protein [Burkholderia cenocepacia]